MLNRTDSQSLRGFTLIELLVVISIISLLASIVLASLKSARAKALDTRRISDLHQIQIALELYFSNNGKYPDHGSWMSLTDPILSGELSPYLPTMKEPNPSCNYAYASIPATSATDYKVIDMCSDINFTSQPNLLDPARVGALLVVCPTPPPLQTPIAWAVYTPGGKCIR